MRNEGPDYRSEPMDSSEGKGRARLAWDAYARTARRVVDPMLVPVLTPVARKWAATRVADLLGFWMLWHLHGGFAGLEELGMHRATIFRKVKAFRTAFGVHPDEYEFSGVTIDPAEYWRSAATAERKRRS